jgi:hypothetical protein
MSDSNSLYDRFFVMNEEDTVQEIRTSLREMYQDQFPYQELSLIEADIFDLFRGDFPGYRHSTTSYHDLPHTLSVYLATARLFHGAFLAGKIISAKATFNGIIAALMHDVGLIQTEDDTEGTGAKYTQDTSNAALILPAPISLSQIDLFRNQHGNNCEGNLLHNFIARPPHG